MSIHIHTGLLESRHPVLFFHGPGQGKTVQKLPGIARHKGNKMNVLIQNQAGRGFGYGTAHQDVDMVFFQCMNQVHGGFGIKIRIIVSGNFLSDISATSRVLAASNTGEIRFPHTVTASFTKCLHIPGWCAVLCLK